MATKRYFHSDTGEEIQNPTIWNIPPSAHAVVQQDDGTYSCGIYHGYATPHAAIEAYKTGLAEAYARVAAEFADKTPIGHCHYCGQSIYSQKDAISNPFGVYQCRECQ